MKNYVGGDRQSGGGRGRACPEPPQAAQGGSAAKPRCTFVSLRETKRARAPAKNGRPHFTNVRFVYGNTDTTLYFNLYILIVLA